MIKPDDLYNILMGFLNSDTVECPLHCTGCKLINVCDDISQINNKLASEYSESLKVVSHKS